MLSKDTAQAARSLVHLVEEMCAEEGCTAAIPGDSACPDAYTNLDDWCRMCRVGRAGEELKWRLTNEGAYD